MPRPRPTPRPRPHAQAPERPRPQCRRTVPRVIPGRCRLRPLGGRSFPDFPVASSRGNHLPHPRSAIRQGGGNYFNVFLYVPLLGLFFLWTWTCYWVDDDSQSSAGPQRVLDGGGDSQRLDRVSLGTVCAEGCWDYPVLLLAYAVPVWLLHHRAERQGARFGQGDDSGPFPPDPASAWASGRRRSGPSEGRCPVPTSSSSASPTGEVGMTVAADQVRTLEVTWRPRNWSTTRSSTLDRHPPRTQEQRDLGTDAD